MRSAAALVLIGVLASCGGDDNGTDEASSESIATSTTVEATTTTTIDMSSAGLYEAILDAGYCLEDGLTFDDVKQAEYDTVVYVNCGGLEITDSSDGWQVVTSPEDLILRYGDLEEALATVGEVTGCWGELEVQTIVSTRAMDGRVDSRNGLASWSYHPDDGLDILCFKE